MSGRGSGRRSRRPAGPALWGEEETAEVRRTRRAKTSEPRRTRRAMGARAERFRCRESGGGGRPLAGCASLVAVCHRARAVRRQRAGARAPGAARGGASAWAAASVRQASVWVVSVRQASVWRARVPAPVQRVLVRRARVPTPIWRVRGAQAVRCGAGRAPVGSLRWGPRWRAAGRRAGPGPGRADGATPGARPATRPTAARSRDRRPDRGSRGRGAGGRRGHIPSASADRRQSSRSRSPPAGRGPEQ